MADPDFCTPHANLREMCGCGPAVDLGAATPPAPPGRRVVLTRASAIKPKRVKWLWDGRVPTGEITLVAGREGSGKSTFLAWMVRAITRGELPGEFEGTPRAVLYAAAEDSWEHTIVPRLIAARANLDLVYRVDVVDIETGKAKMTLPKDNSEVMAAGLDVGASVLMLDPGLSFLDDRIDTFKTPEVRPALEGLRRAAERYGMAVVMLCHFNKSTGTDVLTKIAGSRAFAEVARAALAVAVDDRDEEDEDDTPREPKERVVILSQAKNNLGRSDHPNMTYTIRNHIVETDEGPANVGRLYWLGETDRSAEQALNGLGAGKRKKPRGDTAQQILQYVRSVFRPVSAGDVEKALPHLNSGTLRKELRRLLDAGELAQPGRGTYSTPTPMGPATTATSATHTAHTPSSSSDDDEGTATSATCDVADVAEVARGKGAQDATEHFTEELWPEGWADGVDDVAQQWARDDLP
ncbi:hypothetical protein Cme02nite_69280 [Catellatospora methionotrophica]|uniref:AAA family ATPase n=1 Tax=Catellatospora methionotrophica TaxID=121620 RepID=A0A8J3PKM0_9ACTN|nr:AAA family ATPase [Catellatospora methionotrophica]GIG18596.1 hypothetical protein Cme02nite_69280 [Catellatospora methionotrophica]